MRAPSTDALAQGARHRERFRQGADRAPDPVGGCRQQQRAHRCTGAHEFPPYEGSFPHSREVIARTFEGLSDDDREKIVFGNAARIYGFDV